MFLITVMRRPRTAARRIRRRSPLLWAVIGSLLAGAAGLADPRETHSDQQPAAPLRVDVNFVQVDVSVTDGQGQFVRGLAPSDFELYEDGKRQEISVFSLVDIPVESRAWGSTAGVPLLEPDVRSNVAEAAGRVYVILLDDLHVHALRSARAKEIAREFIQRHLGPNDLAAVLHTSGRSDASQEFTTRPSLLLQAVDKFAGRKMRSSVLERLEEYERRRDQPSRADVRMNRVTDPLDAQRADQAQRTLKTLTSLSEVLSAAEGRRKAVLLISEGIDYPLQEGMTQTSSGLSAFTSPYASDVLRDLQQAIRAAARANVSIYALDPRGLAGTGDETIEVSSFPENPHLGLTPGAFQDELRQAQDSLRVLADQTGGVASVTSNDFDQAFDRIVRDNSTYYMLGYRSNDKRRDARYRTIDVRVSRPNVRVRARRGYAAGPRGKAEPRGLSAAVEPSVMLRTVLNEPLPTGPLPLRLFAAPFRGAKEASVSVGVEIDARTFRLTEEKGFYTGKVEVALVAFDSQGKFKTGDRQTVELQLKPDTYKAVQAHGLRLLFRLNLPAGRFQLRAAAHEAGTGATGSVFYDLEVPDFSAGSMALSGVILTSDRAGQTPTARMDPIFEGVLPSPPTSLRTFYPTETLIALLEVYGPAKAMEAGVDLVTTIRDSDGRARFSTMEQVRSEEPLPDDEAFGYAVSVPLADLPTGSYVLRIEARARSGTDRSAAREIPFKMTATEPGAR